MMAGRQSQDVRRFKLAALQRFEDAQILFDNNRATGAVYLAGYAVECFLKAVLLDRTPRSKQQAVWNSFRGKAGHNLDSLQYAVGRVGVSLPPGLLRHFLKVSSWTTDLRYYAGSKKRDDARDFLQSAAQLLEWLERQF
jgi:HEPN domain-containing protein